MDYKAQAVAVGRKYGAATCELGTEVMRMVRGVMKEHGASTITYREASDRSGDVNLMLVDGQTFDYDNEPEMVVTIDAIVLAAVGEGPTMLALLKADMTVAFVRGDVDDEWTVSAEN